MSLTSSSPPLPLVVTRDGAAADAILSAAAAAGTEARVLADVHDAAAHWAQAPAVFIGADLVDDLAQLNLPRRTRVHVVGDQAETLCRSSVGMGASPVLLPDLDGALTQALVGAADSDTPVLALIGAHGGAGTSTVAAGLAQAAQRPTLLLDADSDGGGLDLLLGLEAEGGWRWPDLARARGHLGELRGQLPRLDQVDVLAMSRSAHTVPDPEAIAAVVHAARRSYGLVVIDAGRGRCPVATAALGQASTVLLVAAAEVRSIAAGRARTQALVEHRCRVSGLVLRASPGSGIQPGVVADALGASVWAQLPTDRGLVAASVRGGPPNRGAGRRWRRACQQLAQRVAP